MSVDVYLIDTVKRVSVSGPSSVLDVVVSVLLFPLVLVLYAAVVVVCMARVAKSLGSWTRRTVRYVSRSKDLYRSAGGTHYVR